MAHLFVPVPSRTNRRNGCTPDRQHAFIEALRRTGSPALAARSVGVSVRSFWRLRERDHHGSFTTAWIEAVEQGQQRARDDAMDRAAAGEQVRVVRRGRIIGWRTKHDDRLLLAVLGSHKAPPLFDRRKIALNTPERRAREEAIWAEIVAEDERRARENRDRDPDLRRALEREAQWSRDIALTSCRRDDTKGTSRA